MAKVKENTSAAKNDESGAARFWRPEAWKVAGTIAALVLSASALSHSLWEGQQSRSCDYLYSKHDRLGTVVKELEVLSAPLDEIIAEARALYSDLTEAEMQQFVGRIIAGLLSLVESYEREFDRNRDIPSRWQHGNTGGHGIGRVAETGRVRHRPGYLDLGRLGSYLRVGRLCASQD